jgi:hypothetical protein
LNYVEKLKKRKYMKYSTSLSKNTKIGNQALANVPLAKKKTQPKNKKITSLPRAWWGPRQRCLPRVGRRHRGVLCRRPQAALGKGQSTGLNPGPRLCRELGRGARHRWHLCPRPNGRAVGTVDGSPNVTVLAPSPTVHSVPSAGPRQRLNYAEGPNLPTARSSAKVAVR